ncbi:hypothetical protein CLOM_g22571, partial [Closterium sp. NIES-68]
LDVGEWLGESDESEGKSEREGEGEEEEVEEGEEEGEEEGDEEGDEEGEEALFLRLVDVLREERGREGERRGQGERRRLGGYGAREQGGQGTGRGREASAEGGTSEERGASAGRGAPAEWVVAAVVESVGVTWGKARQVARVCGGMPATRVWEKVNAVGLASAALGGVDMGVSP